MVLDDTTAQNNLARLFRAKCAVIQELNVLNEVNYKAFLAPGLEVDDVSECAVGEGGAVDRNVVLSAPVVDTFFVVDLFTDTLDNL